MPFIITKIKFPKILYWCVLPKLVEQYGTCNILKHTFMFYIQVRAVVDSILDISAVPMKTVEKFSPVFGHLTDKALLHANFIQVISMSKIACFMI